MSERAWWGLAWLLWLAAIPLRLAHFAGYGLGDDPIFFRSGLHAIVNGHLDVANPNVTRLGTIVPQMIVFHFMAPSDVSFVLPTFAFALGTHAVSLFLARDLIGARGALLTSAFFLTSPFETLTATAFAPDYIVSFWTVLAALGCWRGLRAGRAGPAALGGAALACAVFSKTSALLALPAFGLATLAGVRRWRGWAAFWATFLLGMGAGSLVFVFLGKSPLHWYLNRADRPEGHDVTDLLRAVLLTYPRYVFGRDDYGNWMFGITAWVAVLGVVVALLSMRSARWRGPSAVVLFSVVGVLLFEFMPHKLDLHRYFSHPRIFRYLAQIAAVLYLAAAFGVERLLQARWAVMRAAAVALAVAAFGFGLWQTPRVSEPSWDANRDGRALSRFFHEHPPAVGTKVQSDYWHCYRLEDMNVDQHLLLQCPLMSTREDKERFLAGVHSGWVVTGGGRVAWYSAREWALDFTLVPGYTPPPSWHLLFEYDGPVRPWRNEPLRVWRVDEGG